MLPVTVLFSRLLTNRTCRVLPGRHSGGQKPNVQVTTRAAGVTGLPPLPLRWRIEATFGTLSNRWHRLTRNLEQSSTAAEDAVSIANYHRLLRAYHRTRYMVT